MSMALNSYEARQYAIHYLKTRKWTPERAHACVFEGEGGPGEPGYDVSHGRIRVPSADPDADWLSVDQLFDEIRAGQLDLFGSPLG